MTVDEIKMAAFNWRDVPPQDLDLPERCLWYALANLYRRFRDGEISKIMGETMTQKLVSTYHRDKTRYDTQRASIQAQANMWQCIEMAANRYGLERTTEAADAFVEAVYGVKLKPKEEPKEELELDESEQKGSV